MACCLGLRAAGGPKKSAWSAVVARDLLCKAMADTCCALSAIDESNQLFEAPRLLVHCTAPSGLRPIKHGDKPYGIKHGDKPYVMKASKASKLRPLR